MEDAYGTMSKFGGISFMKKKPLLSLILPCYNEAEHFHESSENILSVLKQGQISFEIIFFEDQSQDNTWQMIQQFIRKHRSENIKAFQHHKNLGRGQTVTDGIKKAQGEIAGFIDIDCEISPEYIPQFITKIRSGADIVCGHRKYQTTFSGLLRAATSKIYALLVKSLIGTQLVDTEAGYKFFNKAKILTILPKIKDKGWFWDTEIMVRGEMAGLKIVFVPVKFRRRTDKTSTVNLANDTLKYLVNLWRFRKELHRKKLEADKYWYNNSGAFSHQYTTLFGLPVTPVGLFLIQRYLIITIFISTIHGKTFLDVVFG